MARWQAASRPTSSRTRLLGVLTSAVLVAGLVAVATGDGRVAPTGPPVPAASTCDPDPALPKRQFRAMWIATVANLDWPSSPGLSVAQQQAELRSWLDLAVSHRHNAVVVQVRPTADTFWPSPHEPWSAVLTGSQGTDPGYDPLEFMVAEAHARSLELHAWFNPYRVATHDNPSQLHPSHPARTHPEWTFSYGGQLYYDPGVPAVQQHVLDTVMHAVDNYDIDGVHWDDYFYPYPAAGQPIPDQDTFQQYGSGFSDIEDWRRHNVDELVRRMHDRIRASKPWVAFGVSPFGIWRNQSTDPRGSATSGLQSYDAIYADSRRWVREEWLDYVAPQVYWHIGHSAADYAVLVPWWSSVVDGTDVRLYIGQSTYRAGAAGEHAAWQDPAELSDHLFLNRDHPHVDGDIQFRAEHVHADRIGAVSRLVADHYQRPALLPVAPGPGTAPAAPTITSANRTGGGVQLAWQPGGGSPVSYGIYRIDGDAATEPCDFADASNLLATVRADGSTTYVDTTAAPGSTYTYHVTALDRQHRESDPSAGRVVAGSGDTWQVVVDNASAGGFSASANWGTSSWSAQRYGADYRFAEPVAASDPAWFRAHLPSTGSYRVEVWYPASSGYHSATPYLVATSHGNEVVHVDQRTDGGRWVELGTFPLAAGDRNVVGVSRWTTGGGYVIADAVRITRQ